MGAEPLNGSAGLPAALSAFLRGVERRAFVLLWLQSGDADAAERGLAAAIRAFPGPAARMPMAEWPTRFWGLLLALPVPGDGHWPVDLDALARMRLPVRRALLLRQVAGLDEAAAAGLLGLAPAAHQDLLAQACPRGADGQPDADGWRVQAEAIQQAGRGLEAPQLLRIAQLREAALSASPVLPAHPARADARNRAEGGRGNAARSTRRPGRLLAWMAALVLGLAAVAAAWWMSRRPAPPAPVAVAEPRQEDFRVHDHEPAVVEPLPDTRHADATGTLPTALDETAPVDPWVADLALLSWLAAGAPASAIASADGRPVPDAVPATVGHATNETSDPGDWERLDPAEQDRVRAAAAALALEEPQAQARLRGQFAALDAMERRGWRLGPVLGADYVALQPLFGFVGEDERAPLLEALRALTPEQRTLLSIQAQRTPPGARAALRSEFLAQPVQARGAWLDQLAQR